MDTPAAPLTIEDVDAMSPAVAKATIPTLKPLPPLSAASAHQQHDALRQALYTRAFGRGDPRGPYSEKPSTPDDEIASASEPPPTAATAQQRIRELLAERKLAEPGTRLAQEINRELEAAYRVLHQDPGAPADGAATVT